MKKIMLLLMASILFLTMMSCSDEGSTTPTTTDAQMISNEMNGVATEMMATEGASAIEKNSGPLAFIPFGMPIKSSLDKAFSKIYEKQEIQKYQVTTEIFSKLPSSIKQEDGSFDFEGNLGTYTFDGYVYDDLGEIIDANWIIVTGGSDITIIIPAVYTDDGSEFQMTLFDFAEDVIYNEYYLENEYYPNIIDMEVYVDNVVVLGLNFMAEWEYSTFAEEIIPTYLDLTLTLPPFVINVNYNQDGTLVSYGFSIAEGLVDILSVDVDLTYATLDLIDVTEASVEYSINNTTIDFWADSSLEDIMESGQYTLEDQVTIIESRDYVYCDVYSGDTQIGELAARIVWDEDEWNDDTQDYTGANVIELYIEFNDGSNLTIDDLEVLFLGIVPVT
ncbi:MAG: hypothetical protein PF638_15615 [Candidatus Delongbacteria bacterium]|nr:hypothetical protein [Candidatus Delongbacteria bacterium]